MNTEPSQRSSSGGDALLIVVGLTTIAVVALEAAFIHWATWSLLPLIVLTVALAAVGVVWSVTRLIDGADAPRRERRESVAVARSQPAPARRAPQRPVLGQ